jgi:hypothetical protein
MMNQPKCRRCRKQTSEAPTVEGKDHMVRPLPFCEGCRDEMMREGVIPRFAADLDECRAGEPATI